MITRTPRNEQEVRELLAQRPAAWEYLYFAAMLRSRIRLAG